MPQDGTTNPSPAPVQNTKPDYFIGQLSGQIPGNINQAATFVDPNMEFSLQSPDKYWENPDVQAVYGGNYKKFKEQYSQSAQQLQAYDGNKFDKFRTNQRTVTRGGEFLFNTLPTRQHYFAQKADYATSSGAEALFGQWTEPTHDERKNSVESKVWFDYEGKKHILGEEGDGVDSYNDIIRDDNHVNDKGEWITKFVYDPNVINDPYYRGEHGMHAVYAGEYDKFASMETMSGWDAMGWTDWSRDASWYDFAPRTVAGVFSGIIGMFGALGASVSGVLGAEESKQWFETHMLSFSEGLSVRQSVDSKNAGLLGSFDSTAGLIADVGVQLLTGRAFATAGMGVTKLLGGRLTSGLTTALDVSTARWTSNVAMSLYGGKDMYKEALANGFTTREAGMLYFANIGALMGVNKTFNWMDDYYQASKVIKGSSDYISKNSAYTVDMLREVEKSGADDVVKALDKRRVLKKFYDGAADNATKIINKAQKLKGYPKAMLSESMEEMGEFIGEEAVQHAGNFYSWLATGERGEAGEHRFKDMWDKDYWEDFKAELAASAIGGAIGGGIGKTFFDSGSQDEVTKERLIDIVAAGDGDVFLKQLDKMHAEGVLGPKDYSIEYDEESKTFKKMDAASEGAISMNDANKQLLLQEYSYIKGLVDKFGAREAFNKMIAANGELDQVKDLSSSLGSDLRAKVKDYVGLVNKNNAEEEQIKPHTDEMSPEEVAEHYVDQAQENGVTPDVAERIGALKKDIEDIHSGKAVEKYFVEALAKGSVFDPQSEENKDYKEYGKFFLHDMMEASHKSAQDLQVLAENRAKSLKENNKVVDELEDDLSNIETVEALFDKNGRALLSDKAKEKLRKKAESYRIPEEQLAVVVDQLRNKLSGNYTADHFLNSDEFKMLDGSQAMKSNLAYALEAFMDKSLDKRLSDVHDAASLVGLKLDTTENLWEAIRETADEKLLDNEGELRQIIQKLFNPETTSGEARTFGEKIADLLHLDSTYEFYSTQRLIEDTPAGEVVSSVRAQYDRLARLANMAQNLPSESVYEYNPADISFLTRSFTRKNNELVDEGNIFEDASQLINQYHSEKIGGEESVSTFNDIDSVLNALHVIKARRAQLELLQGLGSFEPTDLGHLAILRTRVARAKAAPSTTGREVIEAALSEEEKVKSNKFFNETVLDVTEAYRLHQKGVEVLTPEERKVYDDHLKILSQVQYFLNGDTEAGVKGLVALEEELRVIAEEVQKNLDTDNVIAAQRGLMIAKLEDDARLVSRLLSVSGLEDSDQKEIVNEYNEWLNKHLIERNDGSMKAAFDRIAAMKSLIYQLSDDRKVRMFNEYLDAFPPSGVRDRAKVAREIGLILKFNEHDFWASYRNIIDEGLLNGVPLVAQEEVALTVAAHMNTEAASLIQGAADLKFDDHDNSDVMFVSGLQGTGKSTFTLGVGLRTGLDILSKRFAKEKLEVLVASNSREQVDIVASTAKEFGIHTQLKKVGGTIGVTSSIDQNGKSRPLQLLQLLENEARNNGKELYNVSTIVFDEATFIHYEGDADKTPYTKQSDLAKMITLIREINAKRGNDRPQLRLILTGDPQQNGYIDEGGSDRNIGFFKDFVLSPTPLRHNMRSQIVSRAQFLKKLLASTKHTKPSIDGLSSEWGQIVGDTKLGGIVFNTKGEDFFNDSVIYDNIQQQIDIMLDSSSLDDKFTVGVILPEGETVNNIPEDSRLAQMIEAYGDKVFTVTTHELVQGREFDYVIAKVTNAEIGDAFDPTDVRKESHQARKLSTTIGRARYLSVIMNTSKRTFESEFKEHGLVLPPSKLQEKVIADIRSTKLAMLPSGDAVQFDNIAELEEAIKAQEEVNQTINERIEETLAEEKAEILAEEIQTAATEKLEEKLRDLVEPEANVVADGIIDPQERVSYLQDKAEEQDWEKADMALQTAQAEAELEKSTNIPGRVAARIHLDGNGEFNLEAIDTIRYNIENDVLTPEQKALVDEETITVENMQLSAEEGAVDVNLDKQEDAEIAEEHFDAIHAISDRTEDVAGSIEELEAEADQLVERANRGEDVWDELRNIKDQLIKLEARLDVHDLADAVSVSEALNQSFQDEDTEDITKQDKETAADIMRRMEDLGFIAAYSYNNAYQGRSSEDWDRSYLENLYGRNVKTPADNAAYTELQLAAMGLRTSAYVADFTYELKAYSAKSFTKVAVVATHRNTGEKVIVGGINQFKDLEQSQGGGGTFVKQVKKLLGDRNFSDVGENLSVFKQGIPIENPYLTLRLDLVSPGAINRSKENMRLSNFESIFTNSHIKVSDQIFVCTDVNSPFRGEAFLLYSFNDRYQFNESDVNDLIVNGITNMHQVGDVIKGFKGSIGLIRLDNAPLSLVDIDSMISDIYSKEAIQVTDTINRAKGQERLVTAFAQMHYEILKAENDTNSIDSNLLTFLKNQEDKKDLQFNGRTLSRHLQQWKEEKPETFLAMERLLSNIFRTGNMGTPKLDGEGNPLTARTKRGTRLQAKNKNNVVNLLLAGNYSEEVTDDTVEIALHKLVGAARDIVQDTKANITSKDLFGLIQDILSISDNFKKGLYMHPGIIRGKSKTNTVFGIIDTMPNIKDAFNIKVENFQTPSLRIPVDNLIDLTNDPAKILAKANAEPAKMVVEPTAELLTVVDLSSEQLFQELIAANTVEELKGYFQTAQRALQAHKESLSEITDYNKRKDLEARLETKIQDLSRLSDKKRLELKKVKGNTLEGNIEEGERLASLLVNDKAQITKEIEVLRNAIEAGKMDGKPASSKLSDEQWLYVKTPTFKKWAGNWDAVDADPDTIKVLLDPESKEPKVYYHGSIITDIQEFDTTISKYGAARDMLGAWFSDDAEEAYAYIANQFDHPDNFKEVFGLESLSDEEFNYLHQVVNDYTMFKLNDEQVQMREEDKARAESFIQSRTRVYEVFLRGDKIVPLGDPNEVNNVEDLFQANAEALSKANADLVIFQNAWDSLRETPSNVVAVKNQADIRIIEPRALDVQVRDGESEYMIKFKADIVQVANHFKHLAPFIFSNEELSQFNSDIDSVLNSTEAEVARIMDSDSVDLNVVNNLVSNLRHTANQLKKVVVADSLTIEKRIREMLDREIPAFELPRLQGVSPMLGENTLSQLMVKFHTAKANGGETAEIAAEINKRYITPQETPDSIVDIMGSTPETSVEDFRSKLGQLTEMQKSGIISQGKYKEVVDKMVSRLEETRTFSALMSENSITNEDLNKIKDFEIRTILQSAFDESLDGTVVEIFNSTWGELKKFLSLDSSSLLPGAGEVNLTLDNLAAVERAKAELKNELVKAEAKTKALLSFVVDTEMKNNLMTKFEAIKTAALSNMEAISEAHSSELAEVSMTEASTDNLTPAGDSVQLTPQAVTAVNSLSVSAKGVWINAINGENVDPRTLASDLFRELTLKTDTDTMANIQAYYRDRVSNRNKICKF